MGITFLPKRYPYYKYGRGFKNYTMFYYTQKNPVGRKNIGGSESSPLFEPGPISAGIGAIMPTYVSSTPLTLAYMCI
jgi:hypothetical protein